MGTLCGATGALITSFAQAPDKAKAWQALFQLTQNADSFVRISAADALGIAFNQAPDKVHAWQDLHKLTHDDKLGVRMRVAEALGIAFSNIPDKAEAWQDLQRLTQDGDNTVRVYAYHSLGRATIFRAIESKDDESFQDELKKAIEFFEKSSSEITFSNPSKFCLPFYKSFRTLAFQEADAQENVKRYLDEAKMAIAGSQSKKKLLDVVENLSQALMNIQKAKESSLEERQSCLNAMRLHCERATGILKQAENDVPGAVKLLRKGMPIINQQIKKLLKDIEEESAKFRDVTRETPFETLGKRAFETTGTLAIVEYQVDAEALMNEIVPDLRAACKFLPNTARESLCELQNWENLDFEKRIPLVIRAISHCSSQIEALKREVDEKNKWIEYLKNDVIMRLNNINYNVFKLKIRSADAADNLHALKCELDKVNSLKDNMDRIGQSLADLKIPEQEVLHVLGIELPRIVEDLEDITKNIKDPKTQNILENLEALKTPTWKSGLDIAGALASIIAILIAIL